MMWKQNSRLKVEEPQTQVRYELEANSSPVSVKILELVNRELRQKSLQKLPNRL